MNRFGAFLIHLGISFVIFVGLAALVVLAWYPDFFFQSDGGWQGIRIIVFVDLVLGPLLTLVVFNPGKPASELARDPGIIAAIQVSCLVAGVYVVFQARPIALVHVDGNFYSMTAGAYSQLGLPVPDLSGFPGPWPKRVTVALPQDPIEQSDVRRQALASRTPLRALVPRYQAFTFADLDTTEALRTGLSSWSGRVHGKGRWLRSNPCSGCQRLSTSRGLSDARAVVPP